MTPDHVEEIAKILHAHMTLTDGWARAMPQTQELYRSAVRMVVSHGQGWAVDVFDGRRTWTKTHLGESPLNKAEAHRLAHKLRDPKFYSVRTKRAVNSLTVERGPKVGAE